MFELMRSDYLRLAELRSREGWGFLLECCFFDNGFQAAMLYRVASAMKQAGIPLLPAWLWRLSLFLTGVDVNPRARFGPGLVISHGVGLVVGADTAVGRNCLLHHQVTLGAPTVAKIAECPRIGDDVSIGVGATLLGGIDIGDGAVIGAHALVVSDVPTGGRALSTPARIRDAEVESGDEGAVSTGH